MFRITFILGFLIAQITRANQNISLAPIPIEVHAESAISKFEQTVLYPEGLLNRYQPIGAKISNKTVSNNEFHFTATKTVLFISKSAQVSGLIDSRINLQACQNEDFGYSFKVRLNHSDSIVSNNVEELDAIICLNQSSDSHINGEVRPTIVLGKKYSRTVGPLVIKLIQEQVRPLLKAMTEEIESLR